MSRANGRLSATPSISTLVSIGALAIASLWATAAAAQDSAASTVSPADSAAPAESGAAPAGDQSIIVTGSRLARSTFNTPSPVTVLGAEELERLQVTNVGQVTAELPAFRPSNSPTTNGFGSFNVGAQIVNLRGLGVTRNLVLVDGRRFAPTTREGSVDLNFIPSTLVSRIEVVTGGASAAYGSDALAGVVNVILDTKLQGLKAQVDYGISERGDAGNLHAGFGYGTGFAGGAGHLVIGGEYSNQEGTGNCLSRDWCKTAGVVTNSAFNTPAGVGNGLPNFVRSDTNAGYFITPSGVINGFNNPSPATAGIRNLFGVGGITFAPDGTPQPAQQGSLGFGNFQLGGAIIPGYVEVDLVAPVKRYTLFGHADYDFGSNLKGFIEGSYGHVDGGTFQSSFFSASLPIFADNPYIPAAVRAKLVAPAGAVPVGVNVTAQPTAPYSLNRPAPTQVALNLGRMLTDVGRGFSRSVADTYRGTAGLSGTFGGGFSWDFYYQYGRTNREQTVANQLVNGDPANSVDNPATIANSNAYFRFALDAVVDPATGKPTCRALLSPVADVRAAAAGCVPINLFGAGNVTPEGRNYIYRTLVEDIKLDQHVFAANVRGDVAQLWAGPLSFATGAEYRIDSINVVHDPLSNKFAYFQNFGADFSGRTKVVEGYLEAELPLIKDQSWTKSLTLNGAVREAHYDINGFGSYLRANASNSFNATTWKVSAVWEPTHWLRVRGTRSRDVRAPNFAELFLASASSFTPIRNPFNGNVSNTPSLLGGGNPNARPEIASTTTLGVVFAPDSGALARFRFSADWYDIKVRDYLSAIPGGAQTIVDKCFAGFTDVCSLINKGAGISAGQTITEIRNITTNLDQIRSRGIDFEAAYRAPVGPNQIQLRAIATYVQELSAVSLGDKIDRAGQTGGSAGLAAPKWIVNGTASFIAPRWSLTLQTRLIDSGLFDAQRIGPDDPGYSPTLLNSINDNHVDSRFYFNLFGSVFLDSAKRFELFGSVNNLFDQAPPAAPETQFYTNPVYFDTIGRYYRIGARVKM